MRPLFFALALLAGMPAAYSQENCAAATANQTYVNASDGGNITFYTSGRVGINGKVDRNFTFNNNDCFIDLYYKGRKVNTLMTAERALTYRSGPSEELRAKLQNCDCLLDKRNIIYTHLQKD